MIGETVPEQVEIKLDGRVVVSASVAELRERMRGRWKGLCGPSRRRWRLTEQFDCRLAICD